MTQTARQIREGDTRALSRLATGIENRDPEALETLKRAREERPELAAKLRAAHVELTAWINAHSDEAKAQVRAGLSAAVRREVSAELVAAAWSRLHFTDRIEQGTMEKIMTDAQTTGLLKAPIPLDRLFSGKP